MTSLKLKLRCVNCFHRRNAYEVKVGAFPETRGFSSRSWKSPLSFVVGRKYFCGSNAHREVRKNSGWGKRRKCRALRNPRNEYDEYSQFLGVDKSAQLALLDCFEKDYADQKEGKV